MAYLFILLTMTSGIRIFIWGCSGYFFVLSVYLLFVQCKDVYLNKKLNGYISRLDLRLILYLLLVLMTTIGLAILTFFE